MAPGTLADAQSRLLRVFEPLDEAIAERQRRARLVQGDETRWMIHQRSERGENPRCWLWVCVSEDAVRMHIDPNRSARAARVLFAELGETLPVILVCDRYGAYRKLARELAGRFVLATCWVHARRDYIRAAQRHPELRVWSARWLKRFAGLYTRNARRLSHFVRDAAMSAQPPAFVAAHRRLKRKVLELFETAQRELHGLPEDSPKAPALRALVREREGLTVFLDSPSTPMDNNASERAIRAAANSRKVSFGSHGATGARLSAVLFSLFATLAMAGINPHHWLLDYLHACAENAGEAPANLDPWLPWTIDDARLERLRHPYPVQPHGP
ncbi:MAG: transposase [Thiotrichales bacterium]|nr:transposase [Thiotrichales bacterium]